MLKFTVKRDTLGSQMEASLLSDGIKKSGDVKAEKYDGTVWRFCRMIACTINIEFPVGVDAPELDVLREIWGRRSSLPPAELWQLYQQLDMELYNLWDKAFDEANKSLLPAWEKPASQLTPPEQKELEDEDSFLADSESSTKKK